MVRLFFDVKTKNMILESVYLCVECHHPGNPDGSGSDPSSDRKA